MAAPLYGAVHGRQKATFLKNTHEPQFRGTREG
jgi:hypothetical protein